MKIIDVTSILNEVELLKVRIEEHWDFVDKFVITEANETYARQPKAFTFLDNEKIFKPYMDKIHYIPLDVTPWLFGHDTRLNQDIQRYFALLRHPEYVTDYRFCLHSDLDEIIDRRRWPQLIEAMKALPTEKRFIRAHLKHFRNFINWEYRPGEIHYGTDRIHRIDGFNFVRDDRKSVRFLHDSEPYGWHFCFLGSPERKEVKLRGFVHHKEVDHKVFAKLKTLKDKPFQLYGREAYYGEPVIYNDPRPHLPKAMVDNWDFWKTWCSNV